MKYRMNNRRSGFALPAELYLVAAGVLAGVAVVLVTLRDVRNAELYDLADRFGGIRQSYGYAGLSGREGGWAGGTQFHDRRTGGGDVDADLCLAPLSARHGP